MRDSETITGADKIAFDPELEPRLRARRLDHTNQFGAEEPRETIATQHDTTISAAFLCSPLPRLVATVQINRVRPTPSAV
jgi:hypothetical protein